jgi:hypothetical protein
MSNNTTEISLYEPIDLLKQVGEDIWIVDGSIVQMAMYGRKIPFPTRMTIVRMTFWGQKKQARSCLKRILQWNPEKVILAHGRWYENNGTAELLRAFRWLE